MQVKLCARGPSCARRSFFPEWQLHGLLSVTSSDLGWTVPTIFSPRWTAPVQRISFPSNGGSAQFQRPEVGQDGFEAGPGAEPGAGAAAGGALGAGPGDRLGAGDRPFNMAPWGLWLWVKNGVISETF